MIYYMTRHMKHHAVRSIIILNATIMLPCSQTWRSMSTSERWNTKILVCFCKGQRSVLQNLIIQSSSCKYMVLQLLFLFKSEVFYMPIVIHFTLHQFINNVNKIYSIGEHVKDRDINFIVQYQLHWNSSDIVLVFLILCCLIPMWIIQQQWTMEINL
jgi:hypothetical protein